MPEAIRNLGGSYATRTAGPTTHGEYDEVTPISEKRLLTDTSCWIS